MKDLFDEEGMKESHVLKGSPLQDMTVEHPYVATTLAPAPLVHPHGETPADVRVQIQHNQPWNANPSCATNTAGLFSTISQTDLPLICIQMIPKPMRNTLMDAMPLPATTSTSSLLALRKPILQPNRLTPIATPQIRHDDNTPL